jgi:hypothetical protein
MRNQWKHSVYSKRKHAQIKSLVSQAAEESLEKDYSKETRHHSSSVAMTNTKGANPSSYISPAVAMKRNTETDGATFICILYESETWNTPTTLDIITIQWNMSQRH